MDNPQELKKAILASLAEKGDYATILKHLSGEEKGDKEEKKQEKLTKLIEPLSELADLMTQNTKGIFMENMDKKLSKSTIEALTKLSDQVNGAIDTLQEELNKTISKTKTELSAEHLNKLSDAKADLEDKLMSLAVEVVSAKADSLLPTLKASGKLTKEEINAIIDSAALSVESQITGIISDYMDENTITVSQIEDFSKEVQKLIPTVDFSNISVDWSQVRNAPNQGGTSAVLVNQLINNALADLPSGSVSDEAYGGTWDGVNDEAPSKNAVYDKIQALSLGAGTGDVVGPVSAVNNRIATFDGTTGKLIKDSGSLVADFATAAQGAKADTATQPADIANFETTTQLNTRDTNNRNTDNHTSGTTNKVYTATEQTKLAGIATGATANSADATLLARANHTGTQTASTISDFDSAVAANSAVTANTAKVSNATHTGDVTGATALTIANGAVTLAKQADMATASVVYRKTAGTGAPEVQTLATLKTDLGLTGTNSGDQTSIVGITGTKAQFDTAVTDGNFMYVGDAPTAHTHLLAAGATDVTATATELNYVDGVTSAIQTQLNAKAPTASPTLTGTTTVDRLDYDRAIGGVNAIGNLGATETIDWSLYTHFTGNLDSNITFTYSNQVSGQTITLYLTYSGAQRTITWPTTTWMDNATGAAPTAPAASGNVMVVTLVYVGTTVYGSATGNYAVYA